MAEKWSVIEKSDDYIGLTPDAQSALKQRYYDKVISASEEFASLDEIGQSNIKNRFFGTESQQPVVGDIIGMEDIPPEQLAHEADARRQERAFRYINSPNNGFSYQTETGETASVSGVTDMSDDDLLESVAMAGEIRHKGKRGAAYDELKRRNYQDQYIRDYLALSEPTGFVQSMKQEAPELVGGTIGGLAGAALTKNPKMTTAMATGGAAIGGAVGRLGKEAYVREFKPEQARYGQDLAKDVAYVAAREGLGELGGRAVMGAGSKLFGPARKDAIKKTAQISDELVETHAKGISAHNIPEVVGETVSSLSPKLTAGQRSGNKLVQTLESIADNAVTSQGRMAEVKVRSQVPSAMQLADNILDDISEGIVRNVDVSEVGALLDDSIEGSATAWKTVTNRLYKNVDNLAKGTGVDISNAVDDAAKIMERVKSGRKFAGSVENKKVFRDIAKMSKNLTFEEAADLRSSLLSEMRRFEKSGDSNARRLVAQYADMVDSAMESAAKQSGVGLEKEWRIANRFYRRGKEKFDQAVIRKVSRLIDGAEPEKVANVLFGTDSPMKVKAVKGILLGKTGKSSQQILSDKHTWDKIRWAWVADKFQGSTFDEGEMVGVYSAKKLQKLFGRGATSGSKKEMMEMAFSPKELERLRHVADTFSAIQKSYQGSVGQVLVGVLQASAAGAMIGGYKRAQSLAVLTAPNLIGRFVTSEVGAKLLSEGLAQAGSTGKFSAGFTGRLISELYNNKKEYDMAQKRMEAIGKREQRQSELKKNVGSIGMGL